MNLLLFPFKLKSLFLILSSFILISCQNTDDPVDFTSDSLDSLLSRDVTGQFFDAPVSNMPYRVEGEVYYTEDGGYFQCASSLNIEFFVGCVKLGEISCTSLITPYDLVDNNENNAYRIAQLILSAADNPEIISDDSAQSTSLKMPAFDFNEQCRRIRSVDFDSDLDSGTNKEYVEESLELFNKSNIFEFSEAREHLNSSIEGLFSEMRIEPENPWIVKDQFQRFVAYGRLKFNNQEMDISKFVTWSSSVPEYLSVNSSGLGAANNAGQIIIEAKYPNNDSIKGRTNALVINGDLQGINIAPTTPELPNSVTQQFSAYGDFVNSSPIDISDFVNWSSDANSSNLSFSDSDPGLAEIQFTNDSGIQEVFVYASYDGILGSNKVSVDTDLDLVKIEISPADNFLTAGTTFQYNAIGFFEKNDGSIIKVNQDITDKVLWEIIGNKKTASFFSDDDKKGLIRTHKSNTVFVKARMEWPPGGGSFINSEFSKLVVTGETLESLEISPNVASIARFTTQKFTVQGNFSDGTTQDLTDKVTWSTQNLDTSVSDSVAIANNETSYKGIIQGLNAGFARVTATFESSSVSASAQLEVTGATLNSLSISPSNATIIQGNSEQFVATGTFSDGSTQNLSSLVTWELAIENDTTSDYAAVENGLNGGNVNTFQSTTGASDSLFVKVSYFDQISLQTIEAQTEITIENFQLDDIEITPISYQAAAGTSIQYRAFAIYSDLSDPTRVIQPVEVTDIVAWDLSSDVDDVVPNDYATISNLQDSKGLVEISDSSSDDVTIKVLANLNGVEGEESLIIKPNVLESIEIFPANETVFTSSLVRYTATGFYRDASTDDLLEIDITDQVNWSVVNVFVNSTDDTLAVAVIDNVDDKGLLVAQFEGLATVSATLSDITADASLTVDEAELISITVEPTDLTLPVGVQQQYVANGLFERADGTQLNQNITQNVNWSVSDNSLADIDNEGLLTTNNGGVINVIAALGDISGDTTLDINDSDLVSVSIEPKNYIMAYTAEQQYTLIGLYSDNSQIDLTDLASWGISNTVSASISNIVDIDAGTGKGLLTGLGVDTGGSVTFSVDATYETPDGAFLSDSTDVTLTESELVSIEISAPGNANALFIPDEMQLTATGIFQGIANSSDISSQDITDSVNWSIIQDSNDPSSSAVVANTVGEKGNLRGILEGDVVIRARLGNVSGDYDISIVEAEIISLSMTPRSVSIPEGGNVQFAVTAVYENSLDADVTDFVTWTLTQTDDFIDLTTVFDPDNSLFPGRVTGLKPGTATVQVSSANGQIDSTTVTVEEAFPVEIRIEPQNAKRSIGTDVEYEAYLEYSNGSFEDITEQVTWFAFDVDEGASTIPTNYVTTDTNTKATISNITGNKGVATPLDIGYSFITLKYSNLTGDSFEPFEILTIQPKRLTAVSIASGTGSFTIPLGEDLQLTGNAIFDDSSIEDYSNHPSSSWTLVSGADQITLTTAGAGAGYLTADSTGDAVVRFTVQSGDEFISADRTITVSSAVIDQIRINPAALNILTDFSAQLIVAGIQTDLAEVDITNSTTFSVNLVPPSVGDVVSIDGDALVTGESDGTADITASYMNSLGVILQDTIRVTVRTANLTHLEISPIGTLLPAGQETQFTLRAFYDSGDSQDVTARAETIWDSSDTSLITISNSAVDKGTASANESGSTGTSIITGNFDGLPVSTDITITDATIERVEISYDGQPVILGDQVEFTALAFLSDSSPPIPYTNQVTFSVDSTDGNTSSFDPGNPGVLNASDAGVINVSFTLNSPDPSVELNTVGLEILDLVLEEVLISPDVTITSIPLDFEVSFSATGRYSQGVEKDITSNVTWQSSNTVVVAMNDNTAVGKDAGTSDITATLQSITSDPYTLSVFNANLETISLETYAVDDTDLSTDLGNSLSMPLGTSVIVRAKGAYDNGSSFDITNQVSWSVYYPATFDTIQNPSNYLQINNTNNKGLARATDFFDADTPEADLINRIYINALDPSSGLDSTNDVIVQITEPSINSLSIEGDDDLVEGGTLQLSAIGDFGNDVFQSLTNEVIWEIDSTFDACDADCSATGDALTASEVAAFFAIGNSSGSKGQLSTTAAVSSDALKVKVRITATYFVSVGLTFEASKTITLSKRELTELIVCPDNGLFDATSCANLSFEQRQINVAEGESQQFFAIGKFDIGSGEFVFEDVTAQSENVTWTSSDPNAVNNTSGVAGEFEALDDNNGSSIIAFWRDNITDPTADAIPSVGFYMFVNSSLTIPATGLIELDSGTGSYNAVNGISETIPLVVNLQDPSAGQNQTRFKFTIQSTGSSVREDRTSGATWNIVDTSIATIEGSSGTPGLVTAVNKGTTFVQATFSGTTYSKQLDVRYGIHESGGETFTPNAIEIVGGDTTLDHDGTKTFAVNLTFLGSLGTNNYTIDVTDFVDWSITPNPSWVATFNESTYTLTANNTDDTAGSVAVQADYEEFSGGGVLQDIITATINAAPVPNSLTVYLSADFYSGIDGYYMMPGDDNKIGIRVEANFGGGGTADITSLFGDRTLSLDTNTILDVIEDNDGNWFLRALAPGKTSFAFTYDFNGTDIVSGSSNNSVNVLYEVTEIGLGSQESCVFLVDPSSDGEFDSHKYCWGDLDDKYNGSGVSGVAEELASTSSIIQDATSFFNGSSHSCVITDSNELICYGKSAQPGTGESVGGSSNIQPVPQTDPITSSLRSQEVFSGLKRNSVALGNAHTCFIESDGKVYCIGDNGSNQLGDNTTTDSETPVEVLKTGGISFDARDISAGNQHTCVIDDDGSNGKVYCWGLDSQDQASGVDDGISSHGIPVELPLLAGWSPIKLSLRNGNSCVVVDSTSNSVKGRVICWGRNQNTLYYLGRKGDASFLGLPDDSDPFVDDENGDPIEGITEISSSVTGNHSCAIDDRGRIFCWGIFANGRLGANLSDAEDYAILVEISDQQDSADKVFKKIGVGSNNSCALSAEGYVYCWGSDSDRKSGGDDSADITTPQIVDFTNINTDFSISELYSNSP